LQAWNRALARRAFSIQNINDFKSKGSMSEFKFGCPKCEQHLQCEEQFAGREIQCPHCHHLIRIPPAPGKTAQFTPESGLTWATFVPPGNAEPPKGLSIGKKADPPPPPGKK
jgi:hypothetical protein